MINYFNIPTQTAINTSISKTMLTDKGDLTSKEKRILREDIESITMKGLLQTRTIGIQAYCDDNYQYDQIVIAEVNMRTKFKEVAIANMIQRSIPVPMFLILHCGDSYCVNWCVKRINQADNTKKVIEEQQLTRFFSTDSGDIIAHKWLNSLDITALNCITIKDLFDSISEKLTMLTIADEVGDFSPNTTISIEVYRSMLDELKCNREEQKTVSLEMKAETQFNAQMKLTTRLKRLQDEETKIKLKMK